MDNCLHPNLELLPERKATLHCSHCHLTIAAEEIGDGYCPECFDASGMRRYDFETMTNSDQSGSRYRCEDCGAIITAI